MRPLADVPAAFPPDRLAIVHGPARWTWGDLDRRSAQWCGWLVERGVVADDLVAFARAHGPELIALAFGIYRAGGTPAPISGKITRVRENVVRGTHGSRCEDLGCRRCIQQKTDTYRPNIIKNH